MVNEIFNKVFVSLKTKSPKLQKTILNLVLPQAIPFNRPLGLKIRKLEQAFSEVEMPLKRATQNHLGGVHACAIATIGEYTAGILILNRIDPSKQRLILKNLNIEYTKQGRGRVIAESNWPAQLSDTNFSQPLEIPMLTLVKDAQGQQLAKIQTLWQVKPWADVGKAK